MDITSGDVRLYSTGSELLQVPVRYGTVLVRYRNLNLNLFSGIQF